jgi:probable addiction module antidote protein
VAFSGRRPAIAAPKSLAQNRLEGFALTTMSAVAEKAGLSRENLYRALGGEARPEFGTVIKVLHALGIDLVARPQGSKAG